MRKLLAFAVALLISAPAFAAVQNVKVSGDIDSTYINRQDFNLGMRTGSTNVYEGLNDQSAFITQTRVRIDADLSDNVSTTVGLINERAWDALNTTGANVNAQDTNVQLYLASVTLREFLYSPLTVSVGRQVFNYGNGLIVGDGGVNNAAIGNLSTVAADLTKQTSYDGVKAILDYKPLTLDMIYFKNSSGATNSGATAAGVNARANDSEVLGINANYQLGDSLNTVAEGYFFARVNGKTNSIGASGLKGDQLYVPGLRVSTNPIKGMNWQAEIAWQAGRKQSVASTPFTGGDNERRNALAYQLMASYAIQYEKVEKYKPSVNVAFTHVSGDKNGSTQRAVGQAKSRETYTAWDPLNEAQGSGTIYNTLYSLTNMNILSVGATAKPLEDVTTAFTWSHLGADKEYNATQNTLTLLQPDGSTFVGAGPVVNGRSLGNEYDVNVNYAYTEDVNLGVSLGWYVPGKDFAAANRSTASQALAHVLVSF